MSHIEKQSEFEGRHELRFITLEEKLNADKLANSYQTDVSSVANRSIKSLRYLLHLEECGCEISVSSGKLKFPIVPFESAHREYVSSLDEQNVEEIRFLADEQSFIALHDATRQLGSSPDDVFSFSLRIYSQILDLQNAGYQFIYTPPEGKTREITLPTPDYHKDR